MNQRKKDIVKEIFERPKATADKVSTLFTHFKHPPKAAPPAEPKAPSSLRALPAAIDIGVTSIKLFQLAESTKAQYEIIALDKEEYPLPLQQDPIVCQRDALKKIVERNKIGQQVIIGLSAKEVQTYHLVFPPMSEGELSEAIRWKITQLKPFGLEIDAVSYDFVKLNTHLVAPSKSTQQRILVVCAARDTIQQKIALLEECGLKPVAIEVAPTSLLNLSKFKTPPSEQNETVMWLDLGAAVSSLVIEKDGLIVFLRNLNLASQHITKRIAQHCKIDEKQAEGAKQKWGLSHWSADMQPAEFLKQEQSAKKAQDESAVVLHSMISLLENFVIDIEHSFKYFSYQISQSQITKFDRVILSGGGANLKNLTQFLSNNLGVPVEKTNPFGMFKVSEAIKSQKQDLLGAPCDFAVAAGLAIAGQMDTQKRISLLSGGEKKSIKGLLNSIVKEKPAKAVALACILAVLLLGFEITKAGFYKWKMSSTAKEVKKSQTQLSRLQSNQLKLAEKEGELSGKKALLEARLALLREGTRRPEAFSGVLASVASVLPADIWITKLLYSERKLTIAGSASDSSLIMNLIENLKSSKDFTDATFSYSQKEPRSEVYNFEVIADVRE